MPEDIRLCPIDDDSDDLSSGVRSDPALEAQGWVRRHLVDPDRARESRELYESMGFEVLERTLSPEDFGQQCRDCASIICRSYILIYTRSSETESAESKPT